MLLSPDMLQHGTLSLVSQLWQEQQGQEELGPKLQQQHTDTALTCFENHTYKLPTNGPASQDHHQTGRPVKKQ